MGINGFRLGNKDSNRECGQATSRNRVSYFSFKKWHLMIGTPISRQTLWGSQNNYIWNDNRYAELIRSKVWKSQKFTVTWKIFREIIKSCFHEIFFAKKYRETLNFCDFHTVYFQSRFISRNPKNEMNSRTFNACRRTLKNVVTLFWNLSF